MIIGSVKQIFRNSLGIYIFYYYLCEIIIFKFEFRPFLSISDTSVIIFVKQEIRSDKREFYYNL